MAIITISPSYLSYVKGAVNNPLAKYNLQIPDSKVKHVTTAFNNVDEKMPDNMKSKDLNIKLYGTNSLIHHNDPTYDKNTNSHSSILYIPHGLGLRAYGKNKDKYQEDLYDHIYEILTNHLLNRHTQVHKTFLKSPLHINHINLPEGLKGLIKNMHTTKAYTPWGHVQALNIKSPAHSQLRDELIQIIDYDK